MGEARSGRVPALCRLGGWVEPECLPERGRGVAVLPERLERLRLAEARLPTLWVPLLRLLRARVALTREHKESAG
jgi:hypothetical protein